ncbi:MAG: tetratricopeptide repeat protein [Armatimonadetes bacterium]|nr:tetratricopeptide repeat protein [Armatimonadota bacterium]MDE2205198.1 tetratricopeptide repeat protein [Armatimonadota bacterium]
METPEAHQSSNPTPATGSGNGDAIRDDPQQRRKVEAELARLGLAPDAIRRFVDSDAHAADRPPADIAKPRAAAVGKASLESLAAMAAELAAANASKRLEELKQVDLGLPPVREVTREEAERAETMLREAQMLRRREKWNDAIAKCHEAINVAPTDAAGIEMLGDLYQSVGRVQEAMAAYKHAVTINPKRVGAERKFGDLLMRQEQWSHGDPEAMPVNPFAAVLLSMLIPGAGQIHNHDTLKGIVCLVLDGVFGWVLTATSVGFPAFRTGRGLHTTPFVTMAVAGIYYIAVLMDANLVARAGGKHRD